MDDFLWIDDTHLVNLSEVAYIEIRTDGATILFSNGQKLALEGDKVEKLRLYLQRQRNESVNTPASAPGFKRERLA